MNFQAKILKNKGKNSIVKIVVLGVDVIILLVKLYFFMKFHKKVVAGTHEIIYLRFHNLAFIT